MFPVERRIRLQVAPAFRRTAFASDDSLVYRDHWSAEVLVRLESSLRDWRSRAADSLLVEDDWVFTSGLASAGCGTSACASRTMSPASLLAGCAREALRGVWLDLSAEAGRRAYRPVRAGAGASSSRGARSR